MRKVKKFFAQFDMFSAVPTLRAKQQPESSSLFSGVLSLLLALFFAYVFISSAVNIFAYKSIKSVQTESKLSGSQVKAKSVFFAIRVGYLPAEESLKYFDIGYYLITEDGQNITHTLDFCRKEQWQKLGQNYQAQFQQYKIGEFFCPDPAVNLSLYKVYYAENPRFIVIYIRPCMGKPYCDNQTAHQEFVQNLTDAEGAIFLLAYFLDEVIDPQQKEAVSYTINTDVELAFTTKRGIIATVEFGSYKIQTDMGVMPVEEIVINEGNFVNSFRETSIQIKDFNDNYALIYLGMNRKFIYMERKVGKIDQMLSYAGGLFSILIGFLSIFLKSYNEYRYELMVAQGVFHEDEDGNRVRQDDLTFPKYLKYEIFDWVQTLFCYNINWKDCLMIDNTRLQANCHLDVTRLFRKIQTMDNSLLHVIDRGEKDCMAIVKPESLNKIKRNRLILEYYEAVVQGKPVMTIEQYVFNKRILKFGIWLSRMHDDDNPIGYHNSKVQNSNSESVSQIKEEGYEPEQFDDKDKVLELAFSLFPNIAAEADQIQLSDQLKQIQMELAQSFTYLSYEARLKIQEKIPIIILHRLKRHIDFEKLKKPPQIPKKGEEYGSQKQQSEKMSHYKKRKQPPPLIIDFQRPKSK